MKCPRCGVELPDNARFCLECGEKIEVEVEIESEEKKEISEIKENSNKSKIGKKLPSWEFVNSIIVNFWKKLDLFGKILIILVLLFLMSFIIAWFSGKSMSALIALVQIALIIVAIFIKKGKIRVQKQCMIVIPIIVSVICIFSYINFFNSPSNNKKGEKIVWSHIILKEIIPEVDSAYGIIESNSENELKLSIYKSSKSQYCDYLNACKNKNFMTDIEEFDNTFLAYNELGYKLHIEFDQYENEMTIVVNSPMELGNLEWPSKAIVNLIPKPDSSKGKFDDDVKKGVKVYIGCIPFNKYNEYINLCIDSGFVLEKEEEKNIYCAKNSDGYKINVEYLGGNIISIHIFEPEYEVKVEIKCVENFIFSRYNVNSSVDGKFETTIDHGKTKLLELILSKGEHIISFENEADSNVVGEIKIDVTKDEKINLEINCHNNKITVYNSTESNKASNNDNELPNVEKGKIRMNKDASSFISDNYQEVRKELIGLGFTNITTNVVYDIDDGFWHQGYVDDVSSIEIDSNKHFKKNDVFDAKSKVVITYRDFEINSPNFKFLKVTVKKLLEDLDNNSAKAKDYYGNKYVQVTGYIDSIQTNGDLNLVSGGNPYELFRVQCEIKSEMKDKVMNLKKGDKVVLKGKVTYVGNVVGYIIDVTEIVSPK